METESQMNNKINLYLVSRKDEAYYLEYVSAVVAAKNPSRAKEIPICDEDCFHDYWRNENLKAKKIGETTLKEGVIHTEYFEA